MTSSTSIPGAAFVPGFDPAALAERAGNAQVTTARVPKLMAACQSFEAVFLSQLMRVMRQGEMKDELFGGTMADGIYREMLDDQLASEMATSGNTGISQVLYDSLEPLALLEQAQRARAAAQTQKAEATGHGMELVSDVVMEASARAGAPDQPQTRRAAP